MLNPFPALRAVLERIDLRLDHCTELLALERERSARAEAALDLAERQLAIAQSNFEWARLRMNQLEGERSQLFAHVLKVPIAPMTIERETASVGAGAPFRAVNGQHISFEDVGDDAARALGLDT